MVVLVTECMDTLLPHSWQVMFHILIALLSASAVGMPVLHPVKTVAVARVAHRRLLVEVQSV